MLLTTTAAIAGVAAKKNAGTIVMGGNVPSSDRVTTFPSFIVTAQSGLLGTQTIVNQISVAAGASLYLASGSNGGTLAGNDRDDIIMYGSQKRDLAGVTSTVMVQPVAGPVLEPSQITTLTYVQYPSGWNQSGQLLSPATTGTETMTINAASDRASTTAGRWAMTLGNLPYSGASPTHV